MSTRRATDPRRGSRGMTLIEVTLATVIAGVGLIAAMTALSQAAVFKVDQESDVSIADDLASGMHVLALSLPRETWDGSPATSAVDLDVFEDLAGATFSPPLTAGRKVHADRSGWAQDVTLTKVSLDDPSRGAAVADGDNVLWEMSVTIRCGAETKGVYSWWIEP